MKITLVMLLVLACTEAQAGSNKLDIAYRNGWSQCMEAPQHKGKRYTCLAKLRSRYAGYINGRTI